MTRADEEKLYNRLRDEMLMKDDVIDFFDFMRANGKAVSSFHIAEIAMHKLRTMVTTIPMELRRTSKAWLTSRGYESEDDGEV